MIKTLVHTVKTGSSIRFRMATVGASKRSVSRKPVGADKNTKKCGQNVTVQLTNNSSILSKYSMSKLGYFEDTFLKFFIDRERARRSPLINRGYYIRAKAVDTIVKRFLSVTQEQNRSCQIVSLGAGFDTLFFRLHSQQLLSDAVVFEVDFPDVVKNKTNMILSNQILSSSVGQLWTEITPSSGIWTDHYRLTGCDLKEIETLSNLLTSCGIDPDKPTLLLSECVMTYMKPQDSSAVIKWASDFFHEAVFITYEQIHPGDAFGQVMQKHFNNLNSPLRCINTYPDAESQINRYISMGWGSVAYFDMNTFFYKLLSKEERKRVEDLEIFDEYEEWHLKCCHYFILGSFSKQFQYAQQTLFPDVQEPPNPLSSSAASLPLHFVHQKDVTSELGTFARYGHTLTTLPSHNAVVMVGGFGEKEGYHRRLSDATVFKCENDSIEKMCQVDIGERMFHSATLLSDSQIFVYGGRRSPVKHCSSSLILKISSELHSSSSGEMNMNVSEIRTHESQDTSSGEVKFSNSSNEENMNFSERVTSSSASSEQYDGNTDSTSVIIVENMELGTSNRSEPVCRWRHTATRILSTDGSESVFIFGGKNSDNSALGDCHIFCVKDRIWSKPLMSEPLEPRHSHCATLWKSRYIVLSGGLDRNSSPLSLLQVIDTQSQPMTVSTLHLTTPLPARYSHTAHIIADKLFLIGGVCLQMTENPPLVIVDLNNLTWSSLQLNPAPGAVILLNKHGSCIRDSQRILLTGGGGNCFSFGTHLNKQPMYIDLEELAK